MITELVLAESSPSYQEVETRIDRAMMQTPVLQ
jgi:hypothetical protein